ncbi:MAG: exo-alpha-sialidase, partial [bacterium]|nr:exo-alpha-sialidase [bacterium]
MTRRTIALVPCLLILASLGLAAAGQAQQVFQHKGIDSRVDYASLADIGLWDDRNYRLTQEDIALLADNEAELGGAVPAFFRIEVRKAWPDIQKGVALYPRSMLNVFLMRHGGFLYEGQLYRKVERRGDRYQLIGDEEGYPLDRFLETGWEELEKALVGEVRVTNPTGAAESAIKINHTNVNQVVAGTNGPGSGQQMHYSTDGGSSWTQSAALPLGNTCCDPTVDWSLNGAFAYASALGHCGSVCDILFYRSSDGGQTWNDLTSDRRRLTTDGLNDKEFLHVDKYPTSPYVDNLYLTYHKQNVMQFARSTDFGDTWAIQAFSSATDQRGIGSDIATDKSGNVYYIWPAFNSQRILVRKSTDGGASFGSVIEIASTEASFDFPIPAMETRAAFIYVAADADLSNGPFADSIYAAWLDTDGPESGTAANNHSRIQVAYSRDGGNTWNLSTPHETADINSVDRFNPWLAVGPDGQVHVIFYDTRRVVNRSGTDLFYSSSADGAVTWTAPVRVTDEISPNIDDTFEFGDYNGADIVLNDVLAIYTDNRNEGGGGADSVDVYAAGIPVGTPCTPQPIADAGPDVQINEGNSTTIGTPAQAGHTYSWSPGGATTAQVLVSPTVTTTYTVTATTSCGSAQDSVEVTVIPAGSNGPQDAVYDGGLGAPVCTIAGSECDSLALLDGVASSEPNQPNTLDACNDGTSGTYHSDESNDRIVVSTLDSGNFTEGDTVQIDATVWAWSTFTADTLDLYYAADATNPSWVFIASIQPSGTDQQVITTQYTLP